MQQEMYRAAQDDLEEQPQGQPQPEQWQDPQGQPGERQGQEEAQPQYVQDGFDTEDEWRLAMEQAYGPEWDQPEPGLQDQQEVRPVWEDADTSHAQWQPPQRAQGRTLTETYFTEEEKRHIEDLSATDITEAIAYAGERIAERKIRSEVTSMAALTPASDPVMSASPQIARRYASKAAQYIAQGVPPENRGTPHARTYGLMAAITEEAVATGASPIDVMRKVVAAYDQDTQARRPSQSFRQLNAPPRPPAPRAPAPQPRAAGRWRGRNGAGANNPISALAASMGLNPDEARLMERHIREDVR